MLIIELENQISDTSFIVGLVILLIIFTTLSIFLGFSKSQLVSSKTSIVSIGVLTVFSFHENTSTFHSKTVISVLHSVVISTLKTVHLTEAVISLVYISKLDSLSSFVAFVHILQACKNKFIFETKLLDFLKSKSLSVRTVHGDNIETDQSEKYISKSAQVSFDIVSHDLYISQY